MKKDIVLRKLFRILFRDHEVLRFTFEHRKLKNKGFNQNIHIENIFSFNILFRHGI